jgi:ammonium transporter, Amt family
LIIIGFGAGAICFFAVNLIKERVGVDDALDVFGVHGVGGTWGVIATGIFATVAVNSTAADGLIYGNP